MASYDENGERVYEIWPEEDWQRADEATFIEVDGCKVMPTRVEVAAESEGETHLVEVHIGSLILIHELEQIEIDSVPDELAAILMEWMQLGAINTMNYLLDIVCRVKCPLPKKKFFELFAPKPKPEPIEWLWTAVDNIYLKDHVSIVLTGKCKKATPT